MADFQQIGDTLSEKYQSKVQAFLAIQPGKVQIMEELPADSSRKTHLFERGNWLVHGQQVHPKTPGYLPPISKAYPANRLGLAKWLVDGKNPLTARVIVNRFWEQIFGNGLVTTLEDFGTQGDKPSHPALLDQLALTFVEEHQWRVKSLLKQIVLSNTYQQTSKVTAALLEKDPYNKYLARSPRYRLSAEAIRDQALRISGLFNPTLFGPSVMPYQPEGVWNVIRHAARWEKDTTGQQYRRAIYTFWRRVSPYPSMLTFDVPSRELCVSRRIRTNTPLQALVTLNDPVYVEAASALATRMIKDGGATVDKQIQYGFQLTLLRTPDETTLNNLIDFYHTTVSKQQQLSAAKAQFINQTTDKTNLQAMEQVASVLLNLDEVLMRN